MNESSLHLPHINNWHLAFVMDCNLRCSYCISHHGAHGKAPRHFSNTTCKQFIKVLQLSEKRARIEFGTGETFLQFNEFIEFVDKMKKCRESNCIQDEISVTTNGTLLDTRKIDELVARDISLVFSFDGSEEIHKMQRTNGRGRTFYKKAFENLLYYRNLIEKKGEIQKTIVRSVVTHNNSLLDLHEFWSAMDFPYFSATVAFPNNVNNSDEINRFRSTQKNYLQDLQHIALKKAKSLFNPGFLSDYTGPLDILDGWTNLLLDRRKKGCGIFSSLLAVNASGQLFPCDQMISNSDLQIGTLEGGINNKLYDSFQLKTEKCDAHCVNCRVENECPSVCLAERYLGLTSEPLVNSSCEFMINTQDIINTSYEILSNGAAEVIV